MPAKLQTQRTEESKAKGESFDQLIRLPSSYAPPFSFSASQRLFNLTETPQENWSRTGIKSSQACLSVPTLGVSGEVELRFKLKVASCSISPRTPAWWPERAVLKKKRRRRRRNAPDSQTVRTDTEVGEKVTIIILIRALHLPQNKITFSDELL